MNGLKPGNHFLVRRSLSAAATRWRVKRWWLAGVALVPLVLFLLMDRLAPLPMKTVDGGFLVAANDGTPLRAFADAGGVWRYPQRVARVSPLYKEALLNYEDRWFSYHPGINPFSLVRAVWQRLRWGRAVSGGSTLTMQVARILDPHSRTIGGKLKQMFRAVQLEWHFSKEQILSLYMDHAPFGGTLEGVGAASHAYLGKSPDRLSHAEAALLAVLPQAPSRLRPDRHPARAQRARDKVLNRMVRLGVWPAETVAEARAERVSRAWLEAPMMAPLLARRLRNRALKAEKPKQRVLRTTVDFSLQWRLESLLKEGIRQRPPGTSAAVLIVENDEMRVRAYAGSADFLDRQRFGHLDMVTAWRSPGSTLKPFLYGLALEEGLVHSESLLVDAPQSFDGYRPENFHGGFLGPVSLSRALVDSLNLPAVDLLDRLGPEWFVGRLRHGGLRLRLPAGARPNLSIILGGAAATLESLTAAFAALARSGLMAPVRFQGDDPLLERRLLSAGAAWIIRDILSKNPRPDTPMLDPEQPSERQVAWKSGTSYGYRDAWAIGVSDRLTVGVWVGRPDGTPLPGYYGAVSAAPFLFQVFDGLPRSHLWRARSPRPESVRKNTICWPLGTALANNDADTCLSRRTAWTLDGAIPPTLPDREDEGWFKRERAYWINPATGLRVVPSCAVEMWQKKRLAVWPLALEPWLGGGLLTGSRPPDWDPACPETLRKTRSGRGGGGLRLVGIRHGTKLRRAGSAGTDPAIVLSALGAQQKLYWLVDGVLRHSTGPDGHFRIRFDTPGPRVLTVLERSGRYDRVEIEVVR